MILAQLTEHPLIQWFFVLVFAEYILWALVPILLLTAAGMLGFDRAPRTRKVLGTAGCGLLLLLLVLFFTGCSPFPAAPDPVTQDAVAGCPCPDFVLARGGVLEVGEDPDTPPPCSVATNCGRHVFIAANNLPGCRAEAARRSAP